MEFLGEFKSWLPKLVNETDEDSRTYVWLYWRWTIHNPNYIIGFHKSGFVRFRVYRDGEYSNTLFFPSDYPPQKVREMLKSTNDERVFVVKEALSIT